jgi:hypothetical protein
MYYFLYTLSFGRFTVVKEENWWLLKGPWHTTGNARMYLAALTSATRVSDSALTEQSLVACASGRNDRIQQSR